MDPNYFRHHRTEMLPFVPDRRARVLEVGCGEGRFSGSLPGTQEVWGIEPSPAADIARAHLTRVFRGTFEQAKAELPSGHFDIVVCNDVIEHMSDHVQFFRDVQQYIAPGGMLVGSIPNVRYYENLFQFLFEKDWHYRDFGILDRTHVSFFTEKSLRKTLERDGFRVVLLHGINSGSHGGTSLRERLYRYAAHMLSVLTLGYFSDILYLQFAFQAVPPPRFAHPAAPNATRSEPAPSGVQDEAL